MLPPTTGSINQNSILSATVIPYDSLHQGHPAEISTIYRRGLLQLAIEALPAIDIAWCITTFLRFLLAGYCNEMASCGESCHGRCNVYTVC